MSGRTEFLGVHFDPLTAAETERWVAGRTADSPFGYIITPNVDHMVRLAEADADVHAAYQAATLTVCDSRVLARLAGLVGVALHAAPGSDLVAALFDHVLHPGDRVCVVGAGADDVARLRSLHPALTIIHHAPPFGLRHNREARIAAARFAAEARARVTLLAVGSPQQELIALEMQRLATAGEAVGGTALCIGASIDFLVGVQRRAPGIVQRAGMEWAWRLGTDPVRLARRYLIDGPAILPLVWRWRAARR